MAETLIAATMLDELRPRLWKRIVLILILTGMAHSLFEGLTLGSAVMVVGLLAVIYMWIDYYFRKNIYRKYQDELIKMTAIK
jgi:O-antigen ligase